MKKFLAELSQDELREVYERNSKLQDLTLDLMIEDELYWIGEYLNCFKGDFINYSIGCYQRNFIILRENKRFIDDFKEFIDYYGGSVKLENRYNEIIEELNHMDEEQEDYDIKIEYMAEDLKDYFIEYLDSALNDISEDDKISYFIEIIVDNSSLENIYIIDESYIAYEETTKSYE